MFFKMLSSLEVIICQIDRFMALYLNAEYNNYFDLSLSLKICTWRSVLSCYIFSNSFLSSSKIICLMPPLVTLALESDLLKCPPSFRYSSLSTHKVNTFFSAIPKCVTALVVIIVTLYVLCVLRKILSQVVPSTNLPQLQLIERLEIRSHIKINMLFIRHLGNKLSKREPEPGTLHTIDVPSVENICIGSPHPIFPLAELNSLGIVNDMEVTKLMNDNIKRNLCKGPASIC